MRFLSKIGLYYIPIQGTTVTVRVVDNPDVVYTGVCELRSQIGTNTAVGLAVKHNRLCNVATLCRNSLPGASLESLQPYLKFLNAQWNFCPIKSFVSWVSA
ncbi:hypothetical protein RHGRI_014387 [Rhododendron griersonianum]|uniref:Uncharacterized protein n=1 Tax=Rhododendron griersonianum TaxID=479676 RepID=A0AAV6K9H9_9ERIC|nr:hypothetical protein RHGRI_014387 [Rhododendron griersonianum]